MNNDILPKRSEEEINQARIDCLESQVNTLLSEINAYTRTIIDLDAEKNQLAAQNARLKEAITRIDESNRRSTGFEPSVSVLHRDIDEAVRLASESQDASKAEIEAAAIERAVKECMPGPCSPPDDPPQGFQEYCEGIASVNDYADYIRQSAKQAEEDHE